MYLDLPGWSGFDRFLFGVAVGALAFAGVDAALDALELREERRQHLRSWRVYALGSLLGGLVAGAIAWYLDSGQVATIVSKFHAYVSLDYRADGRPVNAYVIRPLFSKWGATDLGMADGGVRVFYDELLSGVIQWVFAAPLFSINLFFLTALMQRSLKPLRQLASFEGLDLLIENAVRVLRWGLWMAPVIYSFLKASPDPTWYNQDGLVRTSVATWLNSTMPDNEFRQWSLDIFTALLAFDGLRVLIWFDHMGLRVATLVNLSFIGGDIADEKAARFLGKAQISRAIPEGIRRFGTWAPLLLPFYIPRGAEWDKAWTGAEQMTHVRPPAYLYLVSGYLDLRRRAGAGADRLPVDATRARRQIAAGRRHRRGRRAGVASAATRQWPDDERSGSRTDRARCASKGSRAAVRRSISPVVPPITPIRAGDSCSCARTEGPCGRSGQAPTCGVGVKATLIDEGDNRLFFQCRQQGFDVEARVALSSSEAVETTRLKLINLEKRPRKIMLASLREWVLNETGVEQRDPAYNAIHVGTWFVRSLGAVFAQNRLLKGGARKRADRRLSPEIGFHAIGAAPGTTHRAQGL